MSENILFQISDRGKLLNWITYHSSCYVGSVAYLILSLQSMAMIMLEEEKNYLFSSKGLAAPKTLYLQYSHVQNTKKTVSIVFWPIKVGACSENQNKFYNFKPCLESKRSMFSDHNKAINGKIVPVVKQPLPIQIFPTSQ